MLYYYLVTGIIAIALFNAESASSMPNKGEFLLGIQGNVGKCYPPGEGITSGSTKGSYTEIESKEVVSSGWTFGGSLGYQVFDNGGPELGFEYAYKTIKRDEIGGYDQTYSLTSKYLDILFGWKGFLNVLYFEFGIYLGKPIGAWDIEVTRTTGGRTDTENKTTRGDLTAGLYCGLGLSITFSKSVDINAGIHLRTGSGGAPHGNPVDISNPETPHMFLLKAGIVYKI